MCFGAINFVQSVGLECWKWMDGKSKDNSNFCVAGSLPPVSNHWKSQHPFHGRLTSNMVCKHCEHQVWKEITFYIIMNICATWEGISNPQSASWNHHPWFLIVDQAPELSAQGCSFFRCLSWWWKDLSLNRLKKNSSDALCGGNSCLIEQSNRCLLYYWMNS